MEFHAPAVIPVSVIDKYTKPNSRGSFAKASSRQENGARRWAPCPRGPGSRPLWREPRPGGTREDLQGPNLAAAITVSVVTPICSSQTSTRARLFSALACTRNVRS